MKEDMIINYTITPIFAVTSIILFIYLFFFYETSVNCTIAKMWLNEFIVKNQKTLFLKRINRVNKKYKEKLIPKEKAIENTKNIVKSCVNELEFYRKHDYKKYLDFIKYVFSLQKSMPLEDCIKKAIISELCWLVSAHKKGYNFISNNINFQLNNYKFIKFHTTALYTPGFFILNTDNNKKYVISQKNLKKLFINPKLDVSAFAKEAKN